MVEYLQGIRGQLPSGVNPTIGPDATGVGWVFNARSSTTPAATRSPDLRSFQDWYFALLAGERAGRRGSREHWRIREAVQVTLDPRAPRVVSRRPERRGDGHSGQQQRRRRPLAGVLRARVHGARPRIPEVDRRHRAGGRDAGPARPARRARARDVATVALGQSSGGAWPSSTDAARPSAASSSCASARTRLGDRPREGAAGRGARRPAEGVRVVTTYDRSGLIRDSIHTLRRTLFEEAIVVSLVARVPLPLQVRAHPDHRCRWRCSRRSCDVLPRRLVEHPHVARRPRAGDWRAGGPPS